LKEYSQPEKNQYTNQGMEEPTGSQVSFLFDRTIRAKSSVSSITSIIKAFSGLYLYDNS